MIMEFPLPHRSWVDCDGNKALTFKYHKGEENKILEVINILNKNMVSITKLSNRKE